MCWLEGALRPQDEYPARTQHAVGLSKGSGSVSQICPILDVAERSANQADVGTAVARRRWGWLPGVMQSRSAEMVAGRVSLMITQSLDVSICLSPALGTYLSVSPSPLTDFSQLP